jgi:hypothetical protein
MHKNPNFKGGGVNIWTDEEIQWLLDNYDKGNVQWMADNLGRSYHGVAQKLYKYRLSSTGRNLKKISINPKIQNKEPQEPVICPLPPFHPVMLGIYPSRAHAKNGRIWGKRRKLILKMHDYMCVYCGDEANAVDHVIPINKGGTDHPDNLVAACMFCNGSLGDKTKHIIWINSYPQKLSTGNN